MAKYKIVKDVGFDTFYSVYKQVLFCFWIRAGTFLSKDPSDETLIKEAKAIISPKTIYISE